MNNHHKNNLGFYLPNIHGCVSKYAVLRPVFNITSRSPHIPNCNKMMLCGILFNVRDDPIVEIRMTLLVNAMKKTRNRNNPAMTFVERV